MHAVLTVVLLGKCLSQMRSCRSREEALLGLGHAMPELTARYSRSLCSLFTMQCRDGIQDLYASLVFCH